MSNPNTQHGTFYDREAWHTRSREFRSLVMVELSPKRMSGAHYVFHKHPTWLWPFCFNFHAFVYTVLSNWNTHLHVHQPVEFLFIFKISHTYHVFPDASFTFLNWVKCPSFIIPEDVTLTSAETLVSTSTYACTLSGQDRFFISNTSLLV